MRAQLVAALRALLVFTVLCGLVYPLAVTVVAQLAFGDKADGSLVERDGQVVGSKLIGQRFEGDEWFHPRPSAAGDGYDGMASSASNLGPTNDVLLDAVAERVDAYRDLNGLDRDVEVPVDAVTASGSGLDPHISVANARLQASRVAVARALAVEDVLRLVEAHRSRRVLGFLGEEAVNVLELNLALDRAG
ncbi:MAG: K(+)-transporting ATPase subunit C [Acidimicrobiales bacterium]